MLNHNSIETFLYKIRWLFRYNFEMNKRQSFRGRLVIIMGNITLNIYTPAKFQTLTPINSSANAIPPQIAASSPNLDGTIFNPSVDVLRT